MKRLLLSTVLLYFFMPVYGQFSSPLTQPVDSAVILFDFGLATLRPEADSSLRRLAARWRREGGLRVRITAHADAVGSINDNEELSLRRAVSIEARLKSLGLPDTAFHTEVFGERRPLAANDTDAGRQLNRRATVELIKFLTPFQLFILIVDEKTGKGVESTVVLRLGNTVLDTIQTNRAGRFTCTLPLQTEVHFDILAPGYFADTKTISPQANIKRLRFPIRPASTGEKNDIDNLYFVTNEATLLPRSEPALQRLLAFMRLNPGLRVEIAGHMSYTDAPPVPKNSWQFELSYQRAKMVHGFLIQNGIDPERLSFNGYANWEMRFPSAGNEAEHRENRRVEVRVLE